MKKLCENLKKELNEFGEKGINASNVDLVGKIACTYKDLLTAKAMEEQGEYGTNYRNYEGYSGPDSRDNGSYRNNGVRYEGAPYMQKGKYNNTRMREHMSRMMDGMDQYEYGKERYMHSGDDTRVQEGLEKLMYAMCMFVESAMDFAETPQEKEIIRKHIQKISRI